MPTLYAKLQENLGVGVQAGELLASHTNFKIGGPAQYFFTARTADELARAVQVAAELNLSLTVLGGGTNVLVADSGVPGLVVEVRCNQLQVSGTTITAEAGVRLAYLVQQSVAAELAGLEPLVAVPGTVGGAVYGNAGLPQVARGCIGDWVKEVVVCRGSGLLRLPQAECAFSYRDSLFKHNSDVIVSTTFELVPGEKLRSQEAIKQYVAARKGQPYHMPSSGCIFTNIPITNPDELREKFPHEPKLEEFIARGQLPSSWLIDTQLGLKGYTLGQVQVSKDHANYLVNLGDATAEQVVMLISYIKQQARDKFGLQLQEEVRYLGF
jgi:UDP-N-acetylmuramate dehydrogenase